MRRPWNKKAKVFGKICRKYKWLVVFIIDECPRRSKTVKKKSQIKKSKDAG
jgi:hypothetical protein